MPDEFRTIKHINESQYYKSNDRQIQFFLSSTCFEIVSVRLNIFRCNKNFKFVGVAIQVVYIGYIRLKLNEKKNTCPLRTEIQFRVSVLPDLHSYCLACRQETDLFNHKVITGQIGRHELLLPINHNYDNICNILGFSKSKH